MYLSICRFIYHHDQSMRSLLPEKTIKQRIKRNLISLVGHLTVFILDFVFNAITLVAVFIGKDAVKLGHFTFFLWMLTSGVIAVVMIILSEGLKTELM